MDFGAVAFKPHFIHELIDEIDPAAMVGVDIFAAEWVGNFGWFKAWPGIANDDQHRPVIERKSVRLRIFVRPNIGRPL